MKRRYTFTRRGYISGILCTGNVSPVYRKCKFYPYRDRIFVKRGYTIRVEGVFIKVRGHR